MAHTPYTGKTGNTHHTKTTAHAHPHGARSAALKAFDYLRSLATARRLHPKHGHAHHPLGAQASFEKLP